MSDSRGKFSAFLLDDSDAKEPLPLNRIAEDLIERSKLLVEYASAVIERKFVVLAYPTEDPVAPSPHLLLIVGPVFLQDNYRHGRLAQVARNLLNQVLAEDGLKPPHYATSGGRLTATFDGHSQSWRLKFGDRSIDFGVFDSRLLLYQRQIAQAIGSCIPVSFEYQSTVRPG